MTGAGTHDCPARDLVTGRLLASVVDDEVEEDVEPAEVARDLAVPLAGRSNESAQRFGGRSHARAGMSARNETNTLTKTSLSMYCTGGNHTGVGVARVGVKIGGGEGKEGSLARRLGQRELRETDLLQLGAAGFAHRVKRFSGELVAAGGRVS